MNNNRIFRKRPVVVEAVQWTGINLHEVICFTDGPPQTRSHHAGMMWENYSDLVKRDGLKIYTLEGVMSADIGDWIIKGVKGEHYPCKPDVFAMTYESAAAPPAMLPDIDKYTHGLWPHAVEQLIRFRDDALALGAQPQKPVVLPFLDVAIKHAFGIDVYRADDVLAALDAANVPHKVKE